MCDIWCQAIRPVVAEDFVVVGMLEWNGALWDKRSGPMQTLRADEVKHAAIFRDCGCGPRYISTEGRRPALENCEVIPCWRDVSLGTMIENTSTTVRIIDHDVTFASITGRCTQGSPRHHVIPQICIPGNKKSSKFILGMTLNQDIRRKRQNYTN